MKIQNKLITSHLGILIIPLLVVTSLFFYKFDKLLHIVSEDNHVVATEDTYRSLAAVSQLKAEMLQDYMKSQQLTLETLAKSAGVMTAFNKLVDYHIKHHVKEDGNYDVKDKEYQQIWDEISPNFTEYTDPGKYNWHDIFIICKKHGHIMYTQNKEPDIGQNIRFGNLKDQGIARLYNKVKESKETVFIDFSQYSISDNEPAAFLGTPIITNGEFVGMIALQFPLSVINKIMQNRTGLGETGDSYLVGSDFKLRSTPFLNSDKLSVDSSFAENIELNSEKIKKALAGESGTIVNHDPQKSNTTVLSNYRPVSFLGVNWALISEISETEAFAEIRQLDSKADESFYNTMYYSLGITILFIIIGAITAYFLSRKISKPIATVSSSLHTLTDFVSNLSDTLKNKLAEGDWSQNFIIENKGEIARDLSFYTSNADEVGDMCRAAMEILKKMYYAANATNTCINQVNSALSQVNSTVLEVASGSSQVASASQQLSDGAMQSSSSLEEVNASMTELESQTVSNAENSTLANEYAHKATNVAKTGKEKMNEMCSAMERINANSEETKKIIRTIDDIAFQTNLLALNAAVEAARAGVHGKSFAVVAGEVRNLAARSAKASQETTALIEKNSAEVEYGLEVSRETAESLETIVTNISNTSNLVKDISTHSNNQAASIKEINIALSEIDNVTQQNVARSEETASASEQMSSQASLLKRLVSSFKLKHNTPEFKKTVVVDETVNDSNNNKLLENK